VWTLVREIHTDDPICATDMGFMEAAYKLVIYLQGANCRAKFSKDAVPLALYLLLRFRFKMESTLIDVDTATWLTVAFRIAWSWLHDGDNKLIRWCQVTGVNLDKAAELELYFLLALGDEVWPREEYFLRFVSKMVPLASHAEVGLLDGVQLYKP
jgi:hypothetical protein